MKFVYLMIHISTYWWRMETNTKERFLTKNWNNWLTLGFGIPTLVYAYVIFYTPLLSNFVVFIGMFVLGAVYWTVVELHAARRFVWERKKSADPNAVKLPGIHPLNLVFVLYNLVYWIPVILTFTGIIGYRFGTIAFFAVILFRAVANLYRNNFLTLEQAEIYPFRIPWNIEGLKEQL